MKGKKIIVSILMAVTMLTAIPIAYVNAEQSESAEVVASINLIHEHTGSPSTGDGCYTTPIICGGTLQATQGTRQTTCGKVTTLHDYGVLYDISSGQMVESSRYGYRSRWCGTHGVVEQNSFYGYTSNGTCSKSVSVSYTFYVCPSCGSQYSNSGSCTKVTGYATSCGLSAENACGSIDMVKNVSPSNGYSLSVILNTDENSEDKFVITSYTWEDGSTAESHEVTGNGEYECAVTYTDCNVEKNGTLIYTVSDYDTEPPIITALTPSTTSWTKGNVIVTVTATDNYGVTGYRLNDGAWETGNKLTVTENGTYTVYAKDAIGNVSEGRNIIIRNIDRTVPLLTINPVSVGWTKEDVTVTFLATDNSNDTIYYAVSENGSLTAEQVTGTETSYTVTHNGTYYVYARDLAGNVAKKIFNVSSIDKTAPIIQIHPFTTDWTNQDIEISFSATDNSNDTLVYAVSESDSLTSEEVTGNETSFLVTENSTYYVYTKDLAGNIAKKEVTVSNIDKTAPVITVDERNTAYTNAAYDITFSARDDASGVLYYTVSLNGSLGKGDITGTDTSFAITENNLYYVYAVDRAGNVGKKEVLITNLDFTAPDGSVVLINGLEIPSGSFIWTDKVTANVSATDNIALADKAYNFDSAGYEAEESKEYHVNGSYKVKIRDHVGNEKEIAFLIDNIDSISPTIGDIKYAYADAEGSRVETTDINSLPDVNQMDISFAAEDTQSGLPSTAYRYTDPLGAVSEWSSEALIKDLIYNGDYKIEVRDNCGNVAVKTLTISNMLEKFPVTYLDVNENGEILGSTTKMVKIGQMAAGSEIGIDVATGAYYEGYDYTNCDTITVGDAENIVHRFFKRHYYDVRYYDEDLNLIVAEKVPYGGQAHSPEIPIKESIEDSFYVYEYTFAGWVDKNGNPISLSDIKKDTVLYPSYEEVRATRTYTVQFIVDGEVYDTQKIAAGGSAVTPKSPTKPGYAFSGWDRSYSYISGDLSIYAIFSVNPSYNADSKPEITTQTSLYLPSESDIELLANTEVEYIESKLQVEKTQASAESSNEKNNEFSEWVTIINETTPFADFFDPIKDLYTNEKTKTVAITTTTVAGMAALYSVISLACSLLGGLSLTQLLIFGFVLFRKKIRYVKGAWLTDTDNIRYVDKYGRSVTAEHENGTIVFKRKGKVLRGIDVNDLLEKLNLNKISYKEFEEIVASSEVYTSFSKNLEIETWNVKSSHGKTNSRARGFNLAKNLGKIFNEAGQYAVRMTQNGKQTLFEIRYAMESI